MMEAGPPEDREIIERYTDQPAVLPPAVRERVEAAWGGSPVQLYALADLDVDLRLTRTWVVLGPEHVAVVEEAGSSHVVRMFPRSRIRAVHQTPALSGAVLTLLGEPGDAPLAVLRHTRRQARAMEGLRFVLTEALAGREVRPDDPDREYQQGLAGPIREAQALVAGHDRDVLARLLGYLAPYRREVVVGFVAATLITLVSLVPPWLAGVLIDDVVRPVQDGVLDPRDGAAAAWLAVAAMTVVYLVRQAAALVRLRLMSVLGERVARDLRRELFDHLQALSQGFFDRMKTGSLITRVSSDTDRLWEFLAFGVVDLSLSLVMLAGLGTVLLALDWRLGLVMVAPVPAFCALIYLHGEWMEVRFLRAWRKWSRMTDVLGDTIPGVRVVRAFHQHEQEKARFRARNDAVTDEIERIHRSWTTFWPLLMLAVHATTVAVWALAVPRLLRPPGTLDALGASEAAAGLTAGTFVSFLLYATMFVQPVEVIGQMARTLNRATSSAHRVFEVLDTEPEVTAPPEPVPVGRLRGRITVEDVSFGYDGVRQVLKGVSFDVRPGEFVGLVGPSGGGKTTLVQLVARFYDPTAGRVLVDGLDLRLLDAGTYRRQIGMVLQDPYLFHGTVLDNVRYGLPDATPEDVIRAARAANAHDFILRLPHGYDTVVGERGQTLSGGERQRVSIARAILMAPRILILDEATSAVDTETERKIQEAMDRLAAGRTVLAIAHRLSTLHRADRLLVLKEGRLVEEGTHAELLARKEGVYRRLHELQLQVHGG